MNFKAYDILASLIPGFLLVLVLSSVLNIKYDKDLLVAYLAISFLFGYLVNSAGSWLEGAYFFTWGGKPSDRLLNGKGIWKVKFYHAEKAKALLAQESGNPGASNDELFSIAMRRVAGLKESRIEDFNALYAFSRSLLTTIVVGIAVLFTQHYDDWRYYALSIPTLFVVWLRCKQRGYYYAREVLNEYLRSTQAR